MTQPKRSSPYDQLRMIAAFLGGSGVALGAYGAHGLNKNGASAFVKENWRTAVMYQLIHAVSILTISAIAETKDQQQNRETVTSSTDSSSILPLNTMIHRAGQVMAIGTAMFSGSIYMLCLNIGPKQLLGPATPIGGMLIIAGWVMLLSNGTDNVNSKEKI
jgi:uncharacterized membrane protein YgdD (TMEM256/DUF423 family)